MTETTDKLEQRVRWLGLLNAAWMFHQQMVKDNTSEIIGAKDSDECLFHKAISVAIMDAIGLINQVEAAGFFEEDDEPLSRPGLAG